MRKEDDEMNQFGFNQSMLLFYIVISNPIAFILCIIVKILSSRCLVYWLLMLDLFIWAKQTSNQTIQKKKNIKMNLKDFLLPKDTS